MRNTESGLFNIPSCWSCSYLFAVVAEMSIWQPVYLEERKVYENFMISPMCVWSNWLQFPLTDDERINLQQHEYLFTVSDRSSWCMLQDLAGRHHLVGWSLKKRHDNADMYGLLRHVTTFIRPEVPSSCQFFYCSLPSLLLCIQKTDRFLQVTLMGDFIY